MVASVVWLSVTPAPPQIDFEQGDKLGHLLAYGSLMFWFSQVYAKTTRMFYAIGFIAMGIGLEFVQGQLDYRTFEVFDMYANALGVLLGWALARMLPKILR